MLASSSALLQAVVEGAGVAGRRRRGEEEGVRRECGVSASLARHWLTGSDVIVGPTCDWLFPSVTSCFLSLFPPS